MKNKIWLIYGWMALTVAGSLSAQSDQSFYDVDREVRIAGTIEEISLEPRYSGKAPFLIVRLKENKTGTVYTIEISPAWFFEQDCYPGENLDVVGSHSARGGPNLVIARTVIYRGGEIIVRDKRGFPNWRGSERKGPRRKRRFLP